MVKMVEKFKTDKLDAKSHNFVGLIVFLCETCPCQKVLAGSAFKVAT